MCVETNILFVLADQDLVLSVDWYNIIHMFVTYFLERK